VPRLPTDRSLTMPDSCLPACLPACLQLEFGGRTFYDCSLQQKDFNPSDPWNYVASGQVSSSGRSKPLCVNKPCVCGQRYCGPTIRCPCC
jgi:hypothetical protein